MRPPESPGHRAGRAAPHPEAAGDKHVHLPKGAGRPFVPETGTGPGASPSDRGVVPYQSNTVIFFGRTNAPE